MIVIYEDGDEKVADKTGSLVRYANQVLVIENKECTVVKNRDFESGQNLDYTTMELIVRYIKRYKVEQKDIIKSLLKK